MINHRKKLGLDLWKVPCKPTMFLRICKQNQLELYDVTIKANSVQFYAPIWQRHSIEQSFESITRITTTGILGYILRSLKKPMRVVSILLSIVLWYVLSHMVFEIMIKGENKECSDRIQQTLQDLGYTPPFYAPDITEIKTTLKKTLENEIAWLEIESLGSRYRITYTPKEFASLSELKNDELIAQCDGVIQRFDIEHGNKVRKVNDFVHKGDVLVSNVISDTTGGNKEVYVAGRVFAYTWRDVHVTADAGNMPESFQYFELLMEARREVSKEFKQNDRIDKENILQFSNDMGTIEMVVHYTLIQDITTP